MYVCFPKQCVKHSQKAGITVTLAYRIFQLVVQRSDKNSSTCTLGGDFGMKICACANSSWTTNWKMKGSFVCGAMATDGVSFTLCFFFVFVLFLCSYTLTPAPTHSTRGEGGRGVVFSGNSEKKEMVG